MQQYRLVQIEDYEQFVGAETVERIRKKAKPLHGLHVAHVNSTYYGGGVAELLSSLTLIMNTVGIKTGLGLTSSLSYASKEVYLYWRCIVWEKNVWRSSLCF